MDMRRIAGNITTGLRCQIGTIELHDIHYGFIADNEYYTWIATRV